MPRIAEIGNKFIRTAHQRRTPEFLRQAIEGHQADAHHGRFDERCNACIEMIQELNHAMAVSA